MKKMLWIFLFCLTGCGSLDVAALAPMMNTAPVALSTSTLVLPTDTPTPTFTPTVDFQGTANAAQTAERSAIQTAEAANLAVAQITADAKEAELESARITQDAFSVSVNGTLAASISTGTTYATSVPLTCTAQAVDWTAIAEEQSIARAKMTEVKEAPTQMIAMIDAENSAQYWLVDFFVRSFALMGVGVLCWGIGVFALRAKRFAMKPIPETLRPMPKVQTHQEPAPALNETILRVESTNNAYPSMDRFAVPLPPEKLSKLVDGILSEGKTFVYDDWIYKEDGQEKAPLTRDELMEVRNFMQSNRWVQGSGKRGTLELTDELGLPIFIKWKESQTLPDKYHFKQETSEEA